MTQLKRTLGLGTAVAVVIGTIIGSGIFMKPATMAGLLGSPEWMIAVWVGAGLITLFGALSMAEVAAMYPETGGQYMYFQKMYGSLFAFLYGWAAFAVFNTAGTASIAYVFSTYVGYFIDLPVLPESAEKSIDLFIPLIGHIFPLENLGLKVLTVIILLLFTWINVRSTASGGRLTVVLTVLKVAAIILVIMMIFGSGQGNSLHFTTDSTSVHPTGWALTGAIMAAMSGAFWAYDGWANITFVGGEVQNPQRTIPRSLLVGVLACIGIYVVINLAFLYVLPVDQMAGSSMVASDAARVAMGVTGGSLIAILVILSTLGSTHTNILATTRVTFAMAAQGQFFKKIGEIHPRFGTPANALWLHGIWCSILVFSGSFDTLTDMLIFVSWLFYGMAGLGVFILRYKMKDIRRPYKVWGYPVVPAVFVLFTVCYLALTLCNDIRMYVDGESVFINSMMGLLLIVPGVPVYYYLRRRSENT